FFRIGPLYRVQDPIGIMPVHYGSNTLGAEPPLGAFIALRNPLRCNRFTVKNPYPVSTLVVAKGTDTVDPIVLLSVSFTKDFSVTFSVFLNNIHQKITPQTELI